MSNNQPAHEAVLSEMEAQAKRQLDGMKVNHDVMAKNVLTLVDTIRALRTVQQRAEPQREKRPGTFTDGFDDVTKGFGWPKST